MSTFATEKLVYVGDAGRRGGTLYNRLSDHLNKRGWQTAFRRKVFEYVMGIVEEPRTNITYKYHLRQSYTQITEAIIRNFAFQCVVTRDFADFEVWLIHKYEQQLWNRQKYQGKIIHQDFTPLEQELLQSLMIPFHGLDKQGVNILNEAGVYLIFKI